MWNDDFIIFLDACWSTICAQGSGGAPTSHASDVPADLPSPQLSQNSNVGDREYRIYCALFEAGLQTGISNRFLSSPHFVHLRVPIVQQRVEQQTRLRWDMGQCTSLKHFKLDIFLYIINKQ